MLVLRSPPTSAAHWEAKKILLRFLSPCMVEVTSRGHQAQRVCVLPFDVRLLWH